MIAITGGIGSGKSVVSQILRKMGYLVYDCDSQAKALMNTSSDIKKELSRCFGNDVVIDGNINSKRLAQIVFADKKSLQKLNSIVHPKVKEDILSWSKRHGKLPFVFIETAILEESNLGDIINEVWLVYAPVDVRVQRVMLRNNMKEADVHARIASQKCIDNVSTGSIINDGLTPILPQIKARLNAIL